MTAIPKEIGLGNGFHWLLKPILDGFVTDIAALITRVAAAPDNLKAAVVAGANSATNIAVSGIATTDAIVGVLHYTPDGAVLKSELVGGTTATTNIAVSGIDTTDRLVGVFHDTSGTILADVSGEASITSTGNIQLGSTDTSSDQLLVLWEDASEKSSFADRTSEADITSDGNIQLDTTNTTGDTLIVLWHDKPAAISPTTTSE